MDDMVLKCLEYSGIEKKSEIDVVFFSLRIRSNVCVLAILRALFSVTRKYLLFVLEIRKKRKEMKSRKLVFRKKS